MFELDDEEIFNAGMLEEYIAKMIAAGKLNVALDLSSVDCIYSDCINTLIYLNKIAANSGGCIAIVNPKHKTSEIIRNAGIHTLLKVFNSDADLLAGSGWIKGANAQAIAKSLSTQTPPANAAVMPTISKQPAFVPPPKPPRLKKTQKLKTYGGPARNKSFLSSPITIIAAALVIVAAALCVIFIPSANQFARDTFAKIGGKGSLAPRGTSGDTPAPSFPPPVTAESGSEDGDSVYDDDEVSPKNTDESSDVFVDAPPPVFDAPPSPPPVVRKTSPAAPTAPAVRNAPAAPTAPVVQKAPAAPTAPAMQNTPAAPTAPAVQSAPVAAPTVPAVQNTPAAPTAPSAPAPQNTSALQDIPPVFDAPAPNVSDMLDGDD